MKTMKKVLCVLLVVLMCVTSAPLGGFNLTAEATEYKVGDIIEFGSYPQSEVKDEALIAELNALTPEWEDWTSYGYYSGNGTQYSSIPGDWMRYIDVQYKGNKYRGVKFIEYRPGYTVNKADINNSRQDENGYYINISYWFIWEPIKWRVLDSTKGLVLSEFVLDSQCYTEKYYGNGSSYGDHFLDPNKTIFSNNYEHCFIRDWLNSEFFCEAFDDNEKEKIEPTLISNKAYNSRYTCANTTDKVFLPSWDDLTNISYGFSSRTDADEKRKTTSSDYAKSQGVRIDNDQPWWWMRTAGEYSYGSTYVIQTHLSFYADVCISSVGIRPAMVLENIIDNGSSGGNSGSTDEPDTPDEPKPDGYKLKLWSDGAYSDSIAVGESIGFDVYLLENGKYLDCERPYAVSFDVPGIFEVSQIKRSTDSMYIKLIAMKPGTTNMTISDNVTGAYVTVKLKAENKIKALTLYEFDDSAKKQDDILTHLYNQNGIYINGFNVNENRDGSYHVVMNAYNEKAHYGAVVAYDKDGNITDYDLIKQKKKLPTNLWSGTFDVFDWVTYKFEVFGEKPYTHLGCTQWTPIDIKVPKDGHLVITNNTANEMAFLANMTDLAMDFAFAYVDFIFADIPEDTSDEVVKLTIGQLILKMGEKALSKFCSDFIKQLTVKMTFTNIGTVLDNFVEALEDEGIDFYDIVVEALGDTVNEELFYNIGEDIGLLLAGGPIQDIFKACDYTNTLIKMYDMGGSIISPQTIVKAPPAEEKVRISNGVTVTSEKPLDPDYVLHTYVINQNDDLMTDAVPTIDPLADNYNMYDITLYKSSQAVQPNAKIKVMIPIPAGYDKSRIAVYWYKEDGTLEKMNATVNGSYAIFETDHLSYYVLVEEHVHTYGEDGEICTDCGFDRTEGCGCNCHKTGIAGFFWKVINFFNKIFKLKQECKCGIKHY